MKRIIISSLVLAVLLTACAIEQPNLGCSYVPLERIEIPADAPSSQEQAEAPTYRAGEFWIFRVKQQNLTYWTSNVLDGDYEATIGGGRLQIFHLGEEQRVEINRRDPFVYMLPTRAIRQERTQYFEFPLWVGKKWKATFLGLDGSRWLMSENSISGIEVVSAAIGTFRAFRIERRIFWQENPTPGSSEGPKHYFTFFYYYSPQTRSVVKYSFRDEVLDGIGCIDLYHITEVELIKFGSRNSSQKAR